jgi:hypothetical protein
MSGPLLTGRAGGASLAVGPVTVPSLLVLGTDAVLAAAPATPVQLAHACLAVGYAAVIPASWGDELIAAHVIREARAADTPRLQCSCPLVESRLAANGASIAPLTIATVAPPVATALYLRARFAPVEIRVAFAGACPSGSHASIDEWLTPTDLAARLAERGIDLRAQPKEFDSVIPPDRRRFYSEPGGMPSRARLLEGDVRVDLAELGGGDLIVEVAQQLLRSGRALIDVAASHGCTCSGAAGLAGLEYARARVLEREPPRAPSPVLDHEVPVPLRAPTSQRPDTPPDSPVVPSPSRQSKANNASSDAESALAVAKRRSPPSVPSVPVGPSPQATSEGGRRLPRAYIAKRRSSPRGIRQSTITSPPAMVAVPETPGDVARPAAVSPAVSAHSRRWAIITAIGVLAGVTLGWLARLFASLGP